MVDSDRQGTATKEIRLELPFGDLAVAKGFVTSEQVQEALDIQAELTQQGTQKRLGDLMVERGFLLPHQLESIISEQKKSPALRRIGPYELISKLGEGGMGAVLKARDTRNNAIVAIKVLFRRLASDPLFIERFKREGRIGVTLNHPNLVKCLDVGEADGLHYMVLEFVDGEDLGAGLLKRGFYPEEQALAIILAASSGMAHAHEHGLIHRDVKPSNIMCTKEGHVKVMDFGLARELGAADHKLTMTGIVVGTPHYISPEQVEGLEPIDCRSDMYSLGLTLFHVLTGRPPYIGGNLYEILNNHLTKDVPDPREINKNLSPETAALVKWMCRRDRDKRCPDMPRLCEEIRRKMGFPSAIGRDQRLPPSLLMELDAPLKGAASTHTSLQKFVEDLRCPRCSAAYVGDPLLVMKDQRIRCDDCGLVFPVKTSPPTPPPLFTENLELEEDDEKPAPPAPQPLSGRSFHAPTLSMESTGNTPLPVESQAEVPTVVPGPAPRTSKTGVAPAASAPPPPSVTKRTGVVEKVIPPARPASIRKPAGPDLDLAQHSRKPAVQSAPVLPPPKTADTAKLVKTVIGIAVGLAILGVAAWVAHALFTGKFDSLLK